MHKRSIYIIKRGFQFRYVGMMIGMIAAFLILIGINSWIFLHRYGTVFADAPEARQAIILFTMLLTIILLGFGIGLALFAVKVSHTVAGPLYRFECVIDAISRGDLTARSNIRKGDELHDFQDALNQMCVKLQTGVKQDMHRARSTADTLAQVEMALRASPNADAGQLDRLVQAAVRLKEIGSSFKI